MISWSNTNFKHLSQKDTQFVVVQPMFGRMRLASAQLSNKECIFQNHLSNSGIFPNSCAHGSIMFPYLIPISAYHAGRNTIASDGVALKDSCVVASHSQTRPRRFCLDSSFTSMPVTCNIAQRDLKNQLPFCLQGRIPGYLKMDGL